jgi:oxygen-independent coproporphyrinogen-3 oxidase
MAGIYLHIPFCKQACHYCDFHFSTNAANKTELIHAMGEEILLQKDYLQGEILNTIYFGGGTPSLLDQKELSHLLHTIYQTHVVAPDAEITIEANPDDLTRKKFPEFKSIGINRLSIGIQSFDDAILKYLNRVHQADTAIRSVEMARETGFENISIDLIYAIPGLSNAAWQENIAKAVELHPEHISAYTLTIEEKTTFGNWLAKGKLKLVDETLAAGQLETLMADLRRAGYAQYEISNFARAGFESRHNSSYWKGEKYLGIGPSAHSYNKISRQHNIHNNHQYVRSLREKMIPFEIEVLKKGDHINEYILTTLRTDKGCNTEKLRSEFDYDLLSVHAGYLEGLLNHKLITIQNNFLRLTEPGRLVADKISSDLFLIE